ncbi:hypothetical protein KIN20_021809 [Parelaphostrongylus tenuis]|uniref:Uncharacterized protein n=1 Tax=Parelaphostrongylus tenuis TaxID=148309 RepID=A0AAD5NB43_PARTN|nr:hypothetical protein KIN20_021809 [Parelaphostrongylus tenuis]
MERGCIIVENTVTAVCTNMEQRDPKPCMLPKDPMVTIASVSGPPLTISGSLSTTNFVMANWSRTMWQTVVNRAVRMLASDPYGTHFFSAIATVD